MWKNYGDVIEQLQSHGLKVASLEVDTSKPVRTYVEDDREKRGWYWLTSYRGAGHDESVIVGSFGIWRGTDPGTQKVQLSKQAALTPDQKKAIQKRHRETAKRAKAMREAEAKRAGQRAAKAWAAYVPPGDSAADSTYLQRKGIGAHGIRFDPHGHGTIAIPMSDAGGQVHGLQVIRSRKGAKLEKQYWPKGLSTVGRYHMIGSPVAGGLVLVAEGYATAATLHEATGLPAAVAFDANNLMPVSEALRQAYGAIRVLVCGDDDYRQKCRSCQTPTEVAHEHCAHCGEPHGRTNPGRDAAEAAAFAVSGWWVLPRFPSDRGGKKLTDFNDLQQVPDGGQALVRAQVEEALRAAGWPIQSTTPRVGTPAEGRGGRRSAQSVMGLDDLVERFLPIDDGTGKYVFDTWTNRLAHKDQMLALLPADAKQADIKRHPVWMRRGAFYLDEVGFDPSCADPDVSLNTWQGWPMEPVEGSCECILEMLEYLCSNEENATEVYHWLLCWMAYPLQHPGAKMSSAVIMHGPQGTGKSAVFQTLAQIYGDYSTVLDQRGLEDRFNSDWAESKLFILAEEVVTRAEMWHIKNELKELVTGQWIRVNPKHTAAYRQKNQINMVYLSNEGQPLPIDNDDRRHLVVWTPPQLPESWYDKLWYEIENGGVAAFYHYLLHVDLSGWHPKKRPPMTRAKQELVQLSKPSEQRFVEDWMAGDLPVPFGPCTSADLYTMYQRWCRANGVRFPRESHQFLGYIKRLDGWACQRQWVYETFHCNGNPRQRRLIMPPQTTLREYGGMEWPSDKTKAQWLTTCYLSFQNGLEDQAA